MHTVLKKHLHIWQEVELNLLLSLSFVRSCLVVVASYGGGS